MKTQMLRYAVVGIATYVLFVSLTTLLVFLNLNSSASIVIAYIVGTIFNYALSAKWVYKAGDNPISLFGWKSVRYLAAAGFNLILILAINSAFLLYLRNEFLSLVLAPVISTVINFFVMKQVVFRNNPSHPL